MQKGLQAQYQSNTPLKTEKGLRRNAASCVSAWRKSKLKAKNIWSTNIARLARFQVAYIFTRVPGTNMEKSWHSWQSGKMLQLINNDFSMMELKIEMIL